MSQHCPKCGHKIGCSCSGGASIIKAADGTIICTACKAVHEAKLKLQLLKSKNES